MKAGFAKACIDPKKGTRMLGWMDRDAARGCDGIHDSIFARALYMEHEGKRALGLTYDLCFVDRDTCAKIKTAIGRESGLRPHEILLTATHTHAGPAVGTWGVMRDRSPETAYHAILFEASLKAAKEAMVRAVQVGRIEAASGRSALPMNRRRPVNGRIENAPNPGGAVCDVLPVIRFLDEREQTVCLLISAAAHPVIFRGWEISAEYPGQAIRLIGEQTGIENAIFLQGAAGDSRPSVVAAGAEWNWNAGWSEVLAAARLLSGEVVSLLRTSMNPVEPQLGSVLLETNWPLQHGDRDSLGRELRQTAHETPVVAELHARWVETQLKKLRQGPLPESWPVFVHGLQIGRRVRIVAIEGEPVAAHGLAILSAFPVGVTFPLGYANGEAAYLPTSEMLAEGGYEVEGYWEYGLPAPLRHGMESVLEKALADLKRGGIP